MSGNLQQTINWAKTFIQYSPLQAGLGQEPAVSIASMIRASMLNPPMTWYHNRAETTFQTVVGQQDYLVAVPDLAFVEAVSLTDDTGETKQIKDVYNNAALAKSSSSSNGRPNAMSVESSSIVSGDPTFLFRFLGVPDKIYTVTLVYQKMALIFGPFFITNVSASGSNTTYTGTFDPKSFPVGSTASITSCTTAANNGSFTVVSCSSTQLVVANSAGVAEAVTAYVSNFSWDPIPDQYIDVYNNLFLSEVLAMVDDSRAPYYRQRGVSALLSKASGLSEMQKNAFAQQWLARDVERQSTLGMVQLGHTGRGI